MSKSTFFDNIPGVDAIEISENTEIVSVPRKEYDALVRRSALLDAVVTAFRVFSGGYQYENVVRVVTELLNPPASGEEVNRPC